RPRSSDRRRRDRSDAGRSRKAVGLSARGTSMNAFRKAHESSTAPNAALPLRGKRVLELAAIGPVPFAGQQLLRLGADVTVLSPQSDRGIGLPLPPEYDYLNLGKRRERLNLKSESGRMDLLQQLSQFDILLE